MAAFQYTAGARTRNVINIADVGGEGTVAFPMCYFPLHPVMKHKDLQIIIDKDIFT